MASVDKDTQSIKSFIQGIDPTWHHDLTTISYFEDSGRGMKAARNIEAGSNIIQIPEVALITKSSILKIFHHNTNAFPDNVDEHAILALFVYLLFDVPSSLEHLFDSFASYASSLPSTYTTLYFYPDILKHPFVPSFVQVAMQRQRKSLMHHFTLVQAILSRISPDHVMNLSIFEKAWFAVNTRCVSLPLSTHHGNKMALAPFLDMFNHDPSTNISMTLNDGYYSLVTHSSWHKDEQVFINYGPHSNWELWMEYGFTIPRNTQFVPIIDQLMDLFPKSNPIYQWKWAILDNFSLVSEQVLCFPVTYGLKCAIYLLLVNDVTEVNSSTFQSLYFRGDIDSIPCYSSTIRPWLLNLRQSIRSVLESWLICQKRVQSPLNIIMKDSLILLTQDDDI